MGTFTQKFAAIFRLGRLPRDIAAQMAAEGGVRYLAEGIWQTAIFRNFSAPGRWASYKSMGCVGYVAMSQARFVARAGWYNQVSVNIVFDDPKYKDVVWTATPKYLSLAFYAAGHIPNASGRVEIRLHLPDVAEVTRLLTARGVKVQKK